MEKLASNAAPIYHSHSGLALFGVRGTVRRLGGQKIEVRGERQKGMRADTQPAHARGVESRGGHGVERETSSGYGAMIFSLV